MRVCWHNVETSSYPCFSCNVVAGWLRLTIHQACLRHLFIQTFHIKLPNSSVTNNSSYFYSFFFCVLFCLVFHFPLFSLSVIGSKMRKRKTVKKTVVQWQTKRKNKIKLNQIEETSANNRYFQLYWDIFQVQSAFSSSSSCFFFSFFFLAAKLCRYFIYSK